MKYVFDKSGPLSETYAVAGGFLKTDKTLEVPDAQVVLLSALGPTKTGGAGYKIRDLLPDEHGFGLTVYQGSPRSRGSVTLRSPDPETLCKMSFIKLNNFTFYPIGFLDFSFSKLSICFLIGSPQ